MAVSQERQDLLEETERLVDEKGKNQVAASLGITVNSVNARLRELKLLRDYGTENNLATTESPKSEYTLPTLPSEEMPTEDLVEHLTTRSRQRFEAKVAREWIPIQVNVQGPVGITFFGDPHIDDDYCDWDNLRSDIDMINKTECLWAVNLGDVSNNWIGRLQRLWAYQETSAAQAWQLVEWLLSEVDWLCLIKGNHDTWLPNAADPVEWLKKGGIAENWNANLSLRFPNGNEARIIGAHDMPGHSMWNPLHAQVRRARFSGADAHLYISGHRHQWALFHTENAETGSVYWAARARGYKLYDDYATEKGYLPQKYGASITAIIDPDADDPVRFIQCYADTAEAADYLNFKRSGRTTSSGTSKPKIRRKITES